MLALSDIAAQLFHAPILQPVLQVMSIALVIWPIGALHNARIARELGFKALAVRSVIANLLGGGMGIALALAGAGVWALVIRSLVTLVCVVIFAWLKHPWRPQLRFDLGQAPDLLRTGGRLTAAQVISQLGGRGTELIAGLVLTPAAVAMLRVGGQCVDMLMQLSVAPFYQLALPAFSRAVQDGKLDEDVFARLSRLSALAIFPVFFGAMTVASDVLPLMFGEHYAGAGPIMAALCALAIPLQVNLLLTPALTAVGRSDPVLLWAVLATTLSLLFGWLGATWGLMRLVGLAVARMYLTLPIGVAWLKTYAGVSFVTILSSIRAPLLAASGMALAAYGVGHVIAQGVSIWARLPLTVVTGVVVYGLLLMLLDRSILADLRAFRRAKIAA